jgi:antagonist of KipI
MSLKILKAGILDTLQDAGRYGYQQLGINTGGAMDLLAAQTANLLVGNDMNEGVIELFFPAFEIFFEENALIAVYGADFSPTVNGEKINNGQPVMIKENSVLQFTKKKKGQCCYLAVKGGFKINKWLGSYSTNLKAAAGGYDGRKLQTDTILEFNTAFQYGYKNVYDFYKLPWTVSLYNDESGEEEIFVLPGNEWEHLSGESKNNFTEKNFQITAASDRMGYRLKGDDLTSSFKEELISAAVNYGTIQFLPNGQLIILMADCQTTGGYPRVAHVIAAHHSKLAQKQPGVNIKFTLVNQAAAEALLLKQHQHLLQLKNACNFKLQDFLK